MATRPGPGPTPADRSWTRVLQHLNARHPDTILFVARYTLARPDLVAATLEDIEGGDLLWSVTTATSQLSDRSHLTDAPSSAQGFREAFRTLLTAARAAAPGQQLTSLEADLAGRARDHLRRRI